MSKYNQWEIKQLLDLTSKSINSFLINKKTATENKQLKELAFEYAELYESLMDYFTKQENGIEGQKSVENWNEHKQELYNEGSKREDNLTRQ